MENTDDNPACNDAGENLNNNNPLNGDDAGHRRRRTPFTDLSQVDADLALARTLQEQETAFMMLRMAGGRGSDYGSWEDESFGLEDEFDDDDYDDSDEEDHDHSDAEVVDDNAEDAFDANDQGVENDEVDPSAFSSDEAYARDLQDAEERVLATRLLALAGINEVITGDADDEDEGGGEVENEEGHADSSQDVWAGIDPDELSYEELVALGDVVGTESRGLSANGIASLPSVEYKSQGLSEGISDSCVICRLDFEDGDTLTILSCKHSYHLECINNWLQINKVCPVCSAEVSTPGKS